MLIKGGEADPLALKTPLDQEYSRFKSRDLSPWLYDVPSQVLRNGAYRWMCAKTRQLKGLARTPTRRTRRNFNTVMLTSKLFRFVRSNGEVVLNRYNEEPHRAAQVLGPSAVRHPQGHLYPQ